MNALSRAPRRAVLTLLLTLLAACGGGGDGEPAPTVGAAGGSVAGPAGASVTVPAGALAADTPVAIAASSDGAPPLPAGPLGSAVFALTPHGTAFAKAVTVRLPVDPSAVPAGFTPRLYKTNAQGAWEAVPGASVDAGFVTAEVTGFSWFAYAALPPTITTSPASVAVVEPASATFNVSALGSPPFTYQWQRSGDGGVSWVDIAGATARSHTTGATSVAGDDGARFRVVVSNPDGPSTSAVATLTVTTPAVAPVITTQPANAAAAPGGSASFSVVASGANLVYQWQRSNDAGATWADVAGETNASLVLAGLTLADSGAQLRVLVGSGTASATSSAAVLTVTAVAPPPTGSGHVAAGFGFSLLRTASGPALSWGVDGNGSPGNGLPITDQLRPGPMPLSNLQAIAAGGGKGAAIDASGVGLVWGNNGFGELGVGDLDPRNTPTPVVGASPASRYQAVSVGPEHVVWLRTDGRIEAAGFNGVGALGQPSPLYLSMTAVELPGGGRHKLIAAGNNFTLAVRDNGSLWGWGTNNSGQLGRDPSTNSLQGQQHQVLYVPNDPQALCAGFRHAMALDNTGQVWAWGETANGKIGIGPTVGRWAPPTPVQLTGTYTAIACGAEFSLALRDDGVLYAWGQDETGQLGQGRALGMSQVPLAVPGLPPIREMAAGAGLGHVLAVGRDGSVWTWGRNDSGQLGDGTRTDRATPQQVLPAGSVQ